MTVPEAVNSAVPAIGSGRRAMVTDAVEPLASAIWEATVRFQIRSYSLKSLPRSTLCELGRACGTSSPDGRIASCASCAFLLLLV